MENRETERQGDAQYTLRVFIRASESGADDKPTTLIKAIRKLGTRDVELFLPQTSEVVSLGWVPEIVYKMTEGGDILDIVIRPDLALFSGRHGTDVGDVQRRRNEELASASSAKQVVGTPALKEARPSVAHDEVLYRVTYESREIRVNGFILSKPNYDSENDVVFDHLFHNANMKLSLEDIETAIQRPLKKRLGEIVRDLGFTGELKAIFFPDISKAAVRFVNPVTRADFANRQLKAPHLGIRE